MVRLDPGDSVSVPGLSSHAWTLVMGYTGNYGERSSALVPGVGANCNVVFPSRSGAQIVKKAGSSLQAPSDNTAAIYLSAVYGVDFGA